MPSTCPICNGSMLPLFTTMFCPRDCDRPRPAGPVGPPTTGEHIGTIDGWSVHLLRRDEHAPGDLDWNGWWLSTQCLEAFVKDPTKYVRDYCGSALDYGWPSKNRFGVAPAPHGPQIKEAGLIVFRRSP